MEELNLDGLLQANPRAAEQADTIKDTLEALKELRAAGFGGEGYTLAPPYGGKYAVPKPGLRLRRPLAEKTDS